MSTIQEAMESPNLLELLPPAERSIHHAFLKLLPLLMIIWTTPAYVMSLWHNYGASLFACEQLLVVLAVIYTQAHDAANQDAYSPSVATILLLFVTLPSIIYILGLAVKDTPRGAAILMSACLCVSIVLDANNLRISLLSGGDPSDHMLMTALGTKLAALLLEEIPEQRFTTWFCSFGPVKSLLASIKLGFAEFKTYDDLQPLPNDLAAAEIYKYFSAAWSLSPKDSQFSLMVTCFRVLDWRLLLPIFPRLVFLLALFSQPETIRKIISALQDPSRHPNAVVALVTTFSGAFAIMAIARNYDHKAVGRNKTFLRSCLTVAIYKKMQSIDFMTLDDSYILNLVTTNVPGIERMYSHFHDGWGSLAKVVVGLYALHCLVGPIAFVVLIPVVFTIVNTVAVSRIQQARRQVWTEKSESRLQTVLGILHHITSIKIGGLTEFVSHYMRKFLKAEIQSSVEARRATVLIFSMDEISELLPTILLLGGAVRWSRKGTEGLDAIELFSCLAWVVIVSEAISTFTRTIGKFPQSLGWITRIQDFLLTEDLSSAVARGILTELPGQLVDASEPSYMMTHGMQQVVLKQVSSAQMVNGERLLRDISAVFGARDLSMITGPVGCGKSLLLKMLLGEAESVGQIIIQLRSVAYCSQTPWLENKSIQENIIGQNEYVGNWYREILEVCRLAFDISQMPQNDKTIVGNKGCNLSGGQRQRVALARALYAKRRILIIDDIFSSLDQTTAAAIFKNLFGVDGLLRSTLTTVILATSLSEHLPYADTLVTINNQGTTTVVRQNTNFNPPLIATTESLTTREEAQYFNARIATTAPTDVGDAFKVKYEDLVNKDKGADDFGLYYYYVETFGWVRLSIWLGLTFMTSVLEKSPFVVASIWYAYDSTNFTNFTYVALAGLASVLCMTASTAFFFNFVINTSYERIYTIFWDKVMSTTLHVYSLPEVSFLMSRFSGDLGLANQELPYSLMRLVFSFSTLVAEMAMIASFTKYGAVIVGSFMISLILIRGVYIKATRQMRALELEWKTPLHELFLESSAGMQHIRALDWTQSYLTRAVECVDKSQIPYFNTLSVQRWGHFMADWHVAGCAAIVSGLALTTGNETSQGLVGLALFGLLSLGVSFAYHLEDWADLESSFGAMTRLRAFVQTAPTEIEPVLPAEQLMKLTATWPSTGGIEFRDVCAGYGGDNPVANKILRNINLKIIRGQKIVISGRTGCGKTSLMLCLLGFLDYTGSILIDGVEVSTIPRHLLRSRITIIPQDAIELPGSVRFNLLSFPEGKTVMDYAVIDTLTQLGIWNYISSRGGLDVPLKSLDLSQGQKQLVNLARAMLHHRKTQSKIVLMDEATSFVGRNNDIQALIARAFRTSTVVVISHRPEAVHGMDVKIKMGEGAILSSRRVGVPEPGAVAAPAGFAI